MKFYRYNISDIGEIFPSPEISLIEFVLKRETPKGYWIGFKNSHSFKKFVLKDSVKKYAYPTKEAAMINLKKRTKKRIRILKYQIDFCSIALNMIKDKP